MARRRTLTFRSLLLLCCLAVSLFDINLAEEGAPNPNPTPASPAPSVTTTPTPVVPVKKPKTMGEHFLGEYEKAEVKQTDSKEGSGAQGAFHLPEPEPASQNWATRDMVGKSTFMDKLIQVCWSLALVSLLVWIIAKIAEKAGFKQLAVGPSKKSLIEIIERKRLSPGRSILLMRVGPKVLAVAATEKGYETLAEFEGEQFRNFEDNLEPDQKPDPPEPEENAAVTPRDVLRHYLSIIPGTGAKK